MASRGESDSDLPTQNSSFQTLGLGNNSRPIRCRLLRFWSSLSLTGSESHKGITLVFVDEKGSMINGFVPAHESPIFRENPYAIRFIKETIVRPVQDNGPAIQLQQFMIRSYEQLNILANTNLDLPDVVGWIKVVQGYGLHSPTVNAPILLQLLIAPPLEVELALLGNVAAEFKRLLTSRGSTYCVVLFTNALYLASTNATRLYSGPTVATIIEFITSLRSNQNQELPILDAGTKVLPGQLTPIGDLNMYLCGTQKTASLFSCKAQIVEIYRAMAGSPSSAAYCVEMLVDDGQNYTTFVVDDKDIIALTSKMAITQICAQETTSQRLTVPSTLSASPNWQ
ncbi:unnamed protein product [Cochlearia groenlandica]